MAKTVTKQVKVAVFPDVAVSHDPGDSVIAISLTKAGEAMTTYLWVSEAKALRKALKRAINESIDSGD
ncbi:MAG TPA: hypothetical protein VHO01_16455 [Jatrophihabitans sp.]|nr:hypothetical protein [Jatrophihabitans sp.]